MTDNFVEENSIVRKIWGTSDTVLLIFGGAAAEFALNKAVDWLYYTGKLPADPLGRLFSTVSYARRIIFADMETANKSIDSIYNMHKAVEKNRGDTIPDWAYRDVLFMLIHYSIAAHEALEGKLTINEKEEVYDVFYRFGKRMKLQDLNGNYDEWLIQRQEHLEENLINSDFTKDLFAQYKIHLGPVRYYLLIEAQKLIVPKRVKLLLRLHNFSILWLLLPFYKLSRLVKIDILLKQLLLPKKYEKEIKAIEVA